MTIAERNKKAMQNIGLIYTIISEDYANYTDKNDLFQIGFLGLLKAVSDEPEQFTSYAVHCIHNSIKWYLADEYRSTHFDADKLNDVQTFENKTNFEEICFKLDKLLRRSLPWAQINLLKLYYGFDGKSRSLADMAIIMNCSKEYVRQQLEQALRRLKKGYANKERRLIKNELLKELKK